MFLSAVFDTLSVFQWEKIWVYKESVAFWSLEQRGLQAMS